MKELKGRGNKEEKEKQNINRNNHLDLISCIIKEVG